MKIKFIVGIIGVCFATSVSAVDFTYSTTDKDEIAAIAILAKQAGKTPKEYWNDVAKGAFQSYVKQAGLGTPATVEEAVTTLSVVSQHRDRMISERDAAKAAEANLLKEKATLESRIKALEDAEATRTKP